MVSLRQSGVPISEIGARLSLLYPISLLLYLRTHRPKHVVSTSEDLSCILLAFKAFRLVDSKITITQHLSLRSSHSPRFFLRRLKIWITIRLLRLLVPHASTIVTVSCALRTEFSQLIGVAENDIRVIYNPIVPKTPRRRVLLQTSKALTEPTILYVGRLARVKRVDVTLKAFQRLLQWKDASLTIVGSGPLETSLKHLAYRLGIDQRCHFLGHLSNPLPMMAAADILILSSDYEGFGNVLVEAMSVGTQVIATDCPCGPREILADGHFGQLFKPGDHEEAAAKLNASLSGDFWIESHVLMARASEFSVKRSVEAYAGLFVRPRVK